MGLDDPTIKMSKSATGAGHAIALLDPPSTIKKKILRATTDSNPAVDFETAGQPDINSLEKPLLDAGRKCGAGEILASQNARTISAAATAEAEAGRIGHLISRTQLEYR